jgi:hypothetical protein
MKHFAWLGIATLLGASAIGMAQDRDFLTPDEADQLRELRDPNQRLMLYLKFARQRLDIVKETLSKQKPGRSIFIHDTLEDLTHVIEAIDTVSDDAIRRKVDLEKGLAAVVDGEKPILEELNKVIEAQPRDYARYKFTIEQAVETLQDSIELAGQDLKSRRAELASRDKKDKAERDEIGTETDAKAAAAQKSESAKKADDPSKPPKKAPTLYRKGEVQADKDKDK